MFFLSNTLYVAFLEGISTTLVFFENVARVGSFFVVLTEGVLLFKYLFVYF